MHKNEYDNNISRRGYEKFELYFINMTDQSVIFIKDRGTTQS